MVSNGWMAMSIFNESIRASNDCRKIRVDERFKSARDL